jgi:hypothetical protein
MVLPSHGLQAQDATRTTGSPDDTPVESAALREAENLSLSEAGDLLDWLENHKIRPLTVELTPEGRITVRWAA